MKTIITAMALLVSASAFSAALKCPAGEPLLKCVGVKVSGDQVVAAEFMDSAVICQGARGLEMLLGSKGAAFEDTVPVKEIVRMGATSYQYSLDGVDFNLVRVISPTKVNATFTIAIAGQRSSRSLICK